jgi:hypothetical protein
MSKNEDQSHSTEGPGQEPVIESADIGPYPRPMPEGLFDEMPTVSVVFSDGSEEDLFQFYPDEIDFSEEELIGLTREEVSELRRKKDREYLQS